MKTAAVLLASVAMLWTVVARPADPSFNGEGHPQILDEMTALSPDDVAQRLANSSPDTYFLYVQSLWNSGKKDDAVMWFYVARLRYRFHLLAHPDLDPAGDPATYADVNRNFGPVIVNYAAKDIDRWAAAMSGALDWDAAHDNGYTSKTDYKAQLELARSDAAKLHDYVLGNKVSLQSEAKVSGIGVLDYSDGVLTDDHRHKVPRNYPALAPQTSLDSLAGSYQDVPRGPVGRFFFGDKDYAKLGAASVYVLSKQDENSLLVVAKTADGKERDRRVIPVKIQDDAVTINDDAAAKAIALVTHQPTDIDTMTAYLRKDAAGDITIDLEYLMEGNYPGKKTHMRLLDSYWSLVRPASP